MSTLDARDSRYRYVDEVLRTDAAGRSLLDSDLRRRPAHDGAYRHTVTAGDRLDHLGQRYYQRPHRWWEICDANPGVLSPLALIGDEPLRTVRITVPATVPAPPWPTVLADLRGRPGVDSVTLDLGDEPVAVLTVAFNELSVAATALADVVATYRAGPSLSVSAAPVGGRIVVPPRSSRP